jgi:UDP-2,4-diacetamido-2,4,6-trideoxy-beta-L-altropyranose hydrolase
MAGPQPGPGSESFGLNPSFPKPAPLIIRADAHASIGTGHVMRCLALGQAWQEVGGRVRFVMAQEVPALTARLQAEGMEVVSLSASPGSPADAGETLRIMELPGGSWLVLDGYHFGADYQRLIKASGGHLLCLDDYGHAGHYCADLVLNQNIHAHEGLYRSREPETRLLLGTRYALLRQEFFKWRGWPRQIPETAKKILVTLGGGDQNHVTLRVIQALSRLDLERLEVAVVAGGANPHLPELQAALGPCPPSVRLMSNVADMSKLMAWADAAITGGGSTCWELAFMGLPALTIILAAQERPVAEGLAAKGAAVNLGWQGDLTEARLAQALAELIASSRIRARQAHRGRALVDGHGGARVREKLLAVTAGLPQAGNNG